MKNGLYLLGIISFALLPLSASSHSGGTDSLGGHHCYTDCEQYGLKTGEYHFHSEDGFISRTYNNNSNIYDLSMALRLQGRILLQVEAHGEAYYIRSKDHFRYYMKDGDAAYTMMRYFSLGITDKDLMTIPAAGNTDEIKSLPSVCQTSTIANQLKGEILLQVEQHGEAWYIDPTSCRRIYMKDGAVAYEIMRYLGLGITNNDLTKIPEGNL